MGNYHQTVREFRRTFDLSLIRDPSFELYQPYWQPATGEEPQPHQRRSRDSQESAPKRELDQEGPSRLQLNVQDPIISGSPPSIIESESNSGIISSYETAEPYHCIKSCSKNLEVQGQRLLVPKYRSFLTLPQSQSSETTTKPAAMSLKNFKPIKIVPVVRASGKKVLVRSGDNSSRHNGGIVVVPGPGKRILRQKKILPPKPKEESVQTVGSLVLQPQRRAPSPPSSQAVDNNLWTLQLDEDLGFLTTTGDPMLSLPTVTNQAIQESQVINPVVKQEVEEQPQEVVKQEYQSASEFNTVPVQVGEGEVIAEFTLPVANGLNQVPASVVNEESNIINTMDLPFEDVWCPSSLQNSEAFAMDPMALVNPLEVEGITNHDEPAEQDPAVSTSNQADGLSDIDVDDLFLVKFINDDKMEVDDPDFKALLDSVQEDENVQEPEVVQVEEPEPEVKEADLDETSRGSESGVDHQYVSVPHMRNPRMKFKSKEARYQRMRTLNNDASRRCRQNRKLKEQAKQHEMEALKEKNEHLKLKLKVMQEQVDRLRTEMYNKFRNPNHAVDSMVNSWIDQAH